MSETDEDVDSLIVPAIHTMLKCTKDSHNNLLEVSSLYFELIDKSKVFFLLFVKF
jgi:hypothetical protein